MSCGHVSHSNRHARIGEYPQNLNIHKYTSGYFPLFGSCRSTYMRSTHACYLSNVVVHHVVFELYVDMVAVTLFEPDYVIFWDCTEK